jgi:ATP-dependent Clp endopeptidase proteolytic subunit ClpP
MHEIRLYDEIGGWGTTAAEFADSIPNDAESITVRINTPGGAVGDGLAMYHFLKDHSAHVTTIVDGYAASMGSIVALAGDVRQVHKASMFMIHQPWGCGCGNADEMREQADVLDVHTEALLDIYEDATGMDRAEIKALLDGETWMRGEAAIEYGFATELIEANDENKNQAAAHGAFASMVAALTEGRELMSKQKTRKELEAELVAKGEEVVAVEAKVEEVEAEAVAKVEEIKAEVEVVAVERDEIAARLETAEASVLEMRGMVDGIRAELDAAKAEAVEAQEEADKAKAALKNPAVADAVIGDVTPEAKADVDAEADAAEIKALADSESGEVEVAPHYAKYRELMEAGEARKARSYWKANEADIAKEQKALIAAEEEQG